MALALTVDAVDTLPENVRPLYVQKDGKFHLDVDGLPDVTGLKTALEKERAANKAHAKDIEGWKKIGKTPDEIAALVEAKETEAREALLKAGKFDDVLKQHQAKWDDVVKQHQAAWQTEKQALETELNASRASERSAIVGERLVSALTKVGATDTGVEILPKLISDRIKFEMKDGKRTISILKADGETPMAGTGPDGLATIDDLAKEAVAKYPELFKATGAGGGGKPPKDAARGGEKTITRAEYDKLGPFEQASKIREGVKLVD